VNEQPIKWHYAPVESSEVVETRSVLDERLIRLDTVTYCLSIQSGRNAIRIEWAAQRMALRGWYSSRPAIHIGGNEVSIQWVAYGMLVRTSWKSKLVETRLVSKEQLMERPYLLNESSTYIVETRSILNDQLMEWYYSPTESSNWSKRGQVWISNSWHGITHAPRFQSDRNGVNIESVTHGMEWHYVLS